MTGNKLEAILKKSGMPVAEDHFETAQKLPYIAYLSQNSANIFADDKVYLKGNIWRVELYTKFRDKISQTLLESALDDESICYEKTTLRIKEERFNQIIYEFTELE